MATKNEKWAFGKGWEQVRKIDMLGARRDIMEALNITNQQIFYKRMRGEVEPRVSEAQAVEKVFHKYGIKEVWGTRSWKRN